MLLTIHNLPPTTRYTDVKSLLGEKCGMHDIIVDNLLSEGKSKKVTVGLANDSDGAFVVRKLNGLFINGQQLYIEHTKRNANMQDQPYRAPGSYNEEPQVVAPNMVAAWDSNNMVPYVAQMPMEQNLVYAGYGVPQAMYMQPMIQVPTENNRGYSGPTGYQGDNYPSVPNEPIQQSPGNWGNRGRDPDGFHNNDRARQQSPERTGRGRLSRKDRIIAAQKHREENARREPPMQQWPEKNQGPRSFHQPEEFPRQHQNVDDRRQPREPEYRQTDPQWKASRWEPPRADREQEWGNDNRRGFQNNDRKRQHSPERAGPRLSRKDTINAPKKLREDQAPRREAPRQQWPQENQGPRSFHQPEPFTRQPQNVDDRHLSREPEYRQSDPQWEPRTSRWEPPRADREPEWENDIRRDWETGRKEWNDVPEPTSQLRREEPRQWDEPNTQWEQNYPRIPDEVTPEWDYRQEPVIPRRHDSPPRAQDRFRDSRPQKSGFNNRNNGPNWSRDRSGDRNEVRPVASLSRPRPVEDTQRRDRPRSNARQERDRRDDRPHPSRDRPGPKRPDYERVDNYLESKGQRSAPGFKPSQAVPRRTIPKPERNEMYGQKKPFGASEKKNPPPKPADKKLSLRAIINKDQTNRSQATALIAKTVIGIKQGSNTYVPASAFDAFMFKQLKVCIKSRIDVILGEEMCTDMTEVVKVYRAKFPINEDKTLLKQIREKSKVEFDEKLEKQRQEQLAKNEAIKKEVKEKIEVKKEVDETDNNSHADDILNQATLEVPKNENEEKDENTTASGTNTTAVPAKPSVPLVPPNMPKPKKGQPLTDKQVIRQMKLQRKWEYDNDDLYSLDAVTDKAVEDELVELDKLFTAECTTPEDPQEAQICKHITSRGLSDFNKTLRLHITKRFLNIQTGLAIRVFAHGKLPKKESIKQYLKKYRIQSVALKKSVKGSMFMVNLNRFQDFDKLCRVENDVIDGIPVSFKAMHLIGPPAKISRNQIKNMRHRAIKNQIDKDINLEDFEDRDDTEDLQEGDGDAEANIEGKEDFTEIEEFEGKDFTEMEEFEGKDIEDADFAENFEGTELTDFAEDINIGNINEEDLEDF